MGLTYKSNVPDHRNSLAVNIYKKFRNKPPFMVPMLSYDDNKDADTSWIHLMKATKFDEGEFYRYFDLSFSEFRKVLSDIINNQENENKNNKQVKEFMKFCKKAALMQGEYRQKSNWMCYNSKPVIIDAGITKTNYEIAY